MTVEIRQERYDELLRKEAMMDNIERLHKKTTGYGFHDIVGYLLDAGVQQQEMAATDE